MVKPSSEQPRWRHARRSPPKNRLIKRVANLLMIAGGLLLAYPLWSGAYTSVQQGRLDSAFVKSNKAFAVGPGRDVKSGVATQKARERALKQLADLFAKTVRPGDPVAKLTIPTIGLSTVVTQGVAGAAALNPASDSGYLRASPVHYGITPLPGAGRPFAVAGHRTTYGAPFFKLDKLKPGDLIKVETAYATLTYRVAKSTITSPSDVSVLYDRGYDLVLTTCTPIYTATDRLIIWAELTAFTLK
jgi:sortase A